MSLPRGFSLVGSARRFRAPDLRECMPRDNYCGQKSEKRNRKKESSVLRIIFLRRVKVVGEGRDRKAKTSRPYFCGKLEKPREQ